MDVNESLERAAQLRAEADEAERAAAAATETQSFDDFWVGVEDAPETEVIRGVTVRVPSPSTVTLRTQTRLRKLDLAEVSDAQLEEAIDDLFGDGAYQRWHDGGMSIRQLGVVMAWGLSSAGGNRITWAEAYKAVAEGKAPGRLVKERALAAKTGGSTPASAGTGGRSKGGRSRKGSKRKR
ncbi:hypothetical protein [Nocardiopsis synnemataformans]|uniref:hypothetical protein n=1 Tax=Nocardiopsis synnemataformans TaxID=61305 RepID=UPI003EBEFFD3